MVALAVVLATLLVALVVTLAALAVVAFALRRRRRCFPRERLEASLGVAALDWRKSCNNQCNAAANRN